MLLPRADVTQSVQPTPTPTVGAPSALGSTSYNVLTITIAVVAGAVALACFYLLYWRKRPTHPKVQLTGVARLRVGGPDRWRIIEQAQREQEARDRSEGDWGVRRKEEGHRDGVALPKYSRDAVVGDREPNEHEITETQTQTAISVPPPAYDQTVARPPHEARS
ncbi:hypothetical protein FRC10_006550 [Ceratobasidium sp. 414]|nr:hypothetical protein FRC10_006550 [Ceratobasidium sp. 414]